MLGCMEVHFLNMCIKLLLQGCLVDVLELHQATFNNIAGTGSVVVLIN